MHYARRARIHLILKKLQTCPNYRFQNRRFADPEAVVRMQQAIQEKLAAVPGVASVAMTNGAPMDPGRLE